MESIWQKDIKRVELPILEGSKSTDVLIIGGGIAGVLCTHKLKSLGVDCMLVEAKELFCGITKNTTAKITVAHSLLYDKLINRFGMEKTELFLEAQLNACKQYACLASRIDCDFKLKDSYVYTLKDKNKIEKEITALEKLGIKAELSYAEELPIKVLGAVRVKNQAEFHPLKFLYAISKGLPVYENTKVLELKGHKALTNRGEIKFKKLIIATHFPILNKHGAYFLKLYQHRSYVLALKGAKKLKGIYVDESDKGLSFRNYENLLLLGGGGHRTGKSGGSFKELEDFASKHFEGAEIVEKWATQDCISLDGVAYIGQYSKALPSVYVATGFNKWGMSNAMVAANVLSELITEGKSPYEKVFSPSRSILRPQLAVNALESIVGLVTPTAPRCPHLGCALKYNAAEHSWDCPCHGSRFSETGELIDNPATDGHSSLGKSY